VGVATFSFQNWSDLCFFVNPLKIIFDKRLKFRKQKYILQKYFLRFLKGESRGGSSPTHATFSIRKINE